jgi:hypothetical protein
MKPEYKNEFTESLELEKEEFTAVVIASALLYLPVTAIVHGNRLNTPEIEKAFEKYYDTDPVMIIECDYCYGGLYIVDPTVCFVLHNDSIGLSVPKNNVDFFMGFFKKGV